GLGHFQTWDQPEGRAFICFLDHFKRVLAHFQVAGPAPVAPEDYTRPFFGDARSMWEVWTHPQGWFVYLEFVALASLRGVVKVVYLFNWGLAALAALLFSYQRAGRRLDDHERSLLVCCIGFVPLVLVSYPHFRYMARFFPLFLLLVLGAFERAEGLRGSRTRRPALAVAAGCLLLMLTTLGDRAIHNLENVAHLDHYWFPD
ncbi:MAG TPA: hypothetical protein VFC77_05555, partial [Myxococcota bacterium]|nr:hypothetical protein [Myxococcota bacterium]